MSTVKKSRHTQLIMQARLDAEFEHAVAQHLYELQAWRDELESPDGLLRRSTGRSALWLLASAIGWLAVSVALGALDPL